MIILYLSYLVCVLALVVLERVIHSFVLVLWHLFHGTGTDVKTYTALTVMTSIFMWFWNVILGFMAVATTVFGAIVTSGTWIVTLALIGLFFTFVFEYYPSLVEDYINFHNDWFGSGLRALLFEPARLVYTLASVLLPIYNGFIYLAVKMITVVIIPGLEFDASDFLKFVTTFKDFLTHVVASFSAYMVTLSSCAPVDSVTDVSCFEPGLRMFDLITPMRDIRLMVGYGVSILAFNCKLLAAPIDLVLYPLQDINLAKAVHNLVNSVLLAVFQVPMITYERCKYSTGDGLEVLMCIPDFEPAWKSFSSGVRFLGFCLDNWLNIIAVILEEVITGDAPSCSVPPMNGDVQTPNTDLFGTSETRVVGLTPGMYAVTDGWSSQYTVFYRHVERMLVYHSWPLKVDVRHGIAAVRYTDMDEADDGGYSTTSMLGCQCVDTADSVTGSTVMSIYCAISPYNAEAYDTMHLRVDSYIVPVAFQVPDTAKYMECSQVEISVQSVRWPLTRLSKPDLNGVLRNVKDPLQAYADGGSSNSGPLEEPAEADAVVYVVPRCSVSSEELGPDLVCINTFTKAGCYPYCLAVRMTGSMNSVLTLYDSDDWGDHVQLMKRDCGLGTITLPVDLSSTGFAYTRDTNPSDYTARFDMRWNELSGVSYTTEDVPGGVSSGACQYDVNMVTRAKKSSLSAYKNLQSVLYAEQPFVVAGDASLFIEWDNDADGNPALDRVYVRVRRLFGSEVNQFTLLTMPTRIPALGACRHMKDCAEETKDDTLITVPRGYSRSPGNAAPAVATKWSVLFVVNPSIDIYSAFFSYCQEDVNTETSFQIDSAYGTIQIWRVDAFGEDVSLYSQIVERKSSVTIDSFDRKVEWEACANAINMSVTGMTYLNEFNVAVTVLRGSPMFIDVETKRPRAKSFAFIATHSMKLMATYSQPPRPLHHPPPTTFPGQLHSKSYASQVRPTDRI